MKTLGFFNYRIWRCLQKRSFDGDHPFLERFLGGPHTNRVFLRMAMGTTLGPEFTLSQFGLEIYGQVVGTTPFLLSKFGWSPYAVSVFTMLFLWGPPF